MRYILALLIVLWLLWVVFAATASAGTVTFAWDANSPSDNVSNYRIYYGTASRSYSAWVDCGTALTGQVTNLTAGVTYYFAATAYNGIGESGYSLELSATIPAPQPIPPVAPGNFRLKTVSP